MPTEHEWRTTSSAGMLYFWVTRIWHNRDIYIRGSPKIGYNIVERQKDVHVALEPRFKTLKEAKVAYLLRSVV